MDILVTLLTFLAIAVGALVVGVLCIYLMLLPLVMIIDGFTRQGER